MQGTTLASQVNHGRWNSSEHEYFLSLLQTHGKDWKKISTLIPTRNEQQVRSHAQKFYLKLNRRTEKGKAGGKFKITEAEAFYKKIFDGDKEKTTKQEFKQNIEELKNLSIVKQEEVQSVEFRVFEQKRSAASQQTNNLTVQRFDSVQPYPFIEIETNVENSRSTSSEQSEVKNPPIPAPKQVGWQITLFPGSLKAYREWKEINRLYFLNLKNVN